MSPLPSFEDDIFISYAHIDNEPLAKGQNGWIQLLDERLRIRLAQLLGEPAKVWRDKKLQGNDPYSNPAAERADPKVLLAERVESLVSQENSKWTQAQEQTGKTQASSNKH